MHTHFEEISTRLFSPKLWRGFAAPTNMNPTGSSYQGPSGNPAFGFFDDFQTFQTNTGDGPYLIFATDSELTAAQVASTDAAKGVLELSCTIGCAANDELVLLWGRGLNAPFKLSGNDLAFEARVSVDSIAAGAYTIVLGLAEAADGTTNALIADAGALADTNFLGFAKLIAEGADWDGAYKATGQTYQDGAVAGKSKLNALATFKADDTDWRKLGFRYRANPGSVEWYVDGKIAGSAASPAKLTTAEVRAATFPGTAFVTPVIGILTAATPTALDLNVDWWACAQYE